MNSTGWKEWDYRELEAAIPPIDEKSFKQQLQYDEVFQSHYYSELDLSDFEKAAEQRWQEFTGGVK